MNKHHDPATQQRIAETIRSGRPTSAAHRTNASARLRAVALPLLLDEHHFNANGGNVSGDDLATAVSSSYILEDGEGYRAAEISLNYEPGDTDDPIGALRATQAITALLLYAPTDLATLLAAEKTRQKAQEAAGAQAWGQMMCSAVARAEVGDLHDSADAEAWIENLETAYTRLTETLVGFGLTQYDAARMALKAEQATTKHPDTEYDPDNPADVRRAVAHINHGSNATFTRTDLGWALFSHG